MAGGSGATEGGGRGGGGGARDCGKWPMRGRPPPNVSAAARTWPSCTWLPPPAATRGAGRRRSRWHRPRPSAHLTAARSALRVTAGVRSTTQASTRGAPVPPTRGDLSG